MRMLAKAVNYFDKKISWFSTRVSDVGMGVLLAMIGLTVAEVFLRRVFNSPLAFSYELTGAMLVIVVFFTVAYTGVEKSHIGIDILVSRIPPRGRAIIEAVTWLLSFGFFVLITWRSVDYGIRFMHQGHVTAILEIPYYPFVMAVAFGSILLALVFLVQFLNLVISAVSK